MFRWLVWYFPMSQAGFLHLGTTDILGWIVTCCGGCPVHCRLLGSIYGLHLLDASSNSPPTSPQVVTTKNISRYCRVSSGGAKYFPHLEKQWTRIIPHSLHSPNSRWGWYYLHEETLVQEALNSVIILFQDQTWSTLYVPGVMDTVMNVRVL